MPGTRAGLAGSAAHSRATGRGQRQRRRARAATAKSRRRSHRQQRDGPRPRGRSACGAAIRRRTLSGCSRPHKVVLCGGSRAAVRQSASSAPLHQGRLCRPAPADRHRQAETRLRGSAARRLASSRRARSRRFTGARRQPHHHTVSVSDHGDAGCAIGPTKQLNRAPSHRRRNGHSGDFSVCCQRNDPVECPDIY